MAKKKDEKLALWARYKVKMRFNYRLCGSVPQSKQIVPLWLQSRMPKKKPDDAKPIEEIEKEVQDSIEDTVERTTLGFQMDDVGLWVRGGTIKAHLKDCANQIKDVLKIKAFKSKVANMVYLEDYKVYLIKGKSKAFREPDGSYEQPVHIMTRQGPRNALKVINYVEKPSFEFVLLLMDHKEVTFKNLQAIFEYGSVHGYGGERGMGEGRYKFTIKKM